MVVRCGDFMQNVATCSSLHHTQEANVFPLSLMHDILVHCAAQSVLYIVQESMCCIVHQIDGKATF